MVSRRGKQRKGEKRRKSFENSNKEGECWNQCECGGPHKLPVKEVPQLLNGKQPCLVRPELWKKNRIHINCSLNGTWPWISIGQSVSWRRNRTPPSLVLSLLLPLVMSIGQALLKADCNVAQMSRHSGRIYKAGPREELKISSQKLTNNSCPV